MSFDVCQKYFQKVQALLKLEVGTTRLYYEIKLS